MKIFSTIFGMLNQLSGDNIDMGTWSDDHKDIEKFKAIISRVMKMISITLLTLF